MSSAVSPYNYTDHRVVSLFLPRRLKLSPKKRVRRFKSQRAILFTSRGYISRENNKMNSIIAGTHIIFVRSPFSTLPLGPSRLIWFRVIVRRNNAPFTVKSYKL